MARLAPSIRTASRIPPAARAIVYGLAAVESLVPSHSLDVELGLSVPFGRIDRAAVTGQRDSEQPTGADHFRKHVAGQIGGTGGGNLAEHVGAEHADARIDPIRGQLPPSRLVGAFPKPGDAAIRFERDDAVGVPSLVQQQRRRRTLPLMGLPQDMEILIGEDISVLNQEALAAPEKRLEPPQGAGRAEQFAFERVFDGDSQSRSIPETVLDHFGVEMEIDSDLAEPLTRQMPDDEFQQRATVERQERLGSGLGEGAEPGSHSGAQNDRFHITSRIQSAASARSAHV